MSNSAPMAALKGQSPMVKGVKSKMTSGAAVKGKAGKNMAKPYKVK